MMDGGMMGGMSVMMGVWAILVLVTLLAILTAAVLATIWLARKLREGDRGRPAAPSDSAHDELRRRYASGDIDDSEYEHRLATLRRN